MPIDSLNEQIFPRPLSQAPVLNPPPALVPRRAPLHGTSVSLEPMQAQLHAEELYLASHGENGDTRIWDYMTYGPWPDVKSYAQKLREQSASLDTLFFAIRPKETGTVCGQASFLDINAQNGVTEIGHIWFGPQLRRTRAATEALFLMLCHAMDDLGYRRMQWRCNAHNENSRNAARRLGFRFEGIFYNNLIFKGRNRDTAWYSILDDEWPEVRDKIEAWLQPSNFDGSRQPKAPLSTMMAQRTPSQRDQ